jgi:hypothetical protein
MRPQTDPLANLVDQSEADMVRVSPGLHQK